MGNLGDRGVKDHVRSHGASTEMKMGPTIKEGREDQKSKARRLLMLPLLCSHKDGGDCPSLCINKPGFGSSGGKK